jgi:predicted cupin superfamily sugar epimerase
MSGNIYIFCRHGGTRAPGTSIYFLLAAPNCVNWHKHLSDEGFYWHAGGRVKVSRFYEITMHL